MTTTAESRFRAAAVILCLLSFGWIPLKLIAEPRLSDNLTPSVLFLLLAALFVPPFAMLCLVLLTRHVVHRQALDQGEYRSLRLFSLLLGPIAWAAIIFRLTGQNAVA